MKQLKRCAVFCFNADATDADVPMRNAIVLVFMDVKFRLWIYICDFHCYFQYLTSFILLFCDVFSISI